MSDAKGRAPKKEYDRFRDDIGHVQTAAVPRRLEPYAGYYQSSRGPVTPQAEQVFWLDWLRIQVRTIGRDRAAPPQAAAF